MYIILHFLYQLIYGKTNLYSQKMALEIATEALVIP